MGQFPRLILLCVVFVSSNLIACSGSKLQSTLPPLTFEPIANVIISGDCNITSDLETWLQAAEFRVEAFTTFIQDSQEKNRAQLRSEVIQIANVLNSVGDTPAVDCAVDINEQLRQAMTTTLGLYQSYINLERDDLETIQRLSELEFEVVQNGLGELKTLLDSRLQELSGR